jgi:uncharacterized membrane protein YdbT with pleckstrin-like domain
VLAILRVPAEPHVPEGSPESVLVFRAGRNFYRWQVCGWVLSHVGVAAGAILAYIFIWRIVARGPGWMRLLYEFFEIAGLLAVAIALPFTFLALRWNYELRWYIVTDHSLRIRKGVWNVEELTMTFANIQEIRVTSGPIQNLLGLADVEVHSAGGGASGPHGKSNAHVASFEGVDNAATIRDLMAERLRAFRESGLGAESHEIVTSPERGETLQALRNVLDETRKLREALTGAR